MRMSPRKPAQNSNTSSTMLKVSKIPDRRSGNGKSRARNTCRSLRNSWPTNKILQSLGIRDSILLHISSWEILTDSPKRNWFETFERNAEDPVAKLYIEMSLLGEIWRRSLVSRIARPTWQFSMRENPLTIVLIFSESIETMTTSDRLDGSKERLLRLRASRSIRSPCLAGLLKFIIPTILSTKMFNTSY